MAGCGPGIALEARRKVPEWQVWPRNVGAEAMLRLPDGRFIVPCECRASWFGDSRHPAFLYAHDPVQGGRGKAFTFAGVDGFRPTDVAQLPDGRVLILMRRLLWPILARFAIKVVIADPAEIMPGRVWRGHELANIGPLAGRQLSRPGDRA